MTSITEDEAKTLDVSIAMTAAEVIISKFKTIESRLNEMEERITSLEQEEKKEK